MGFLRRRSSSTAEAPVGTPEYAARATLEDAAALAASADLAGLASLMASPSREVRREALKALCGTVTDGTTAALRDAYQADADLAVRQAAAEALACRGDWGPLEALLLQGPPEAQTRAARVLLGLGDCGVAILASALGEGNSALTLRVLRVFELHFRLGSDEQQAALRKTLDPVVPALVKALEAIEIGSGARSYGEASAVTVAMLGNLKDARAIPALGRLLAAVQSKIDREGVERLFVDDGVKAAYISPLDEVKHLTNAIIACGGTAPVAGTKS